MAFEPYELALSGIEVDLETKTVRLTLRPKDNSDIDQHITASVKLDALPSIPKPPKPPTPEPVTDTTKEEAPSTKPK